MSFREKSAWITLTSVLLCFGSYFATLATGSIERASMSAFHYALVSIVALALLQLILQLLARLSNPRDARAPRDERERLFEYRARSIGYYVLMCWMVVLVAAVHFSVVRKLDVVFIAWLGFAIATIVVAVAEIIQFRRGA